MKKVFFRKILIAIIGLSVTGFWGCGDSEKVEYAPTEDQKLVVYTSHKEEVYGPIIAEFEARTGIWVQVVNDGTAVLLNRIRDEGSSGPADIMFGGGVDLLSAYSDCFAAYRVKDYDMLSTYFKSKDYTWVAFSSLPIVIIYNNRLVYKNSVPDSWSDLLDERWKGKIAFADPATSGTSYTSLLTLLQLVGGNNETEVMHEFIDNLDDRTLATSGAVTDTVTTGTRLIGVTLEEAALKKKALGADISIVYPKEGTSAVPDGCAIVKDAAHMDNAKLFMDFIVSYDVQLMLADNMSRRPVRSDVVLNDDRLADIDEIDYDLERAVNDQQTILDEWKVYVEVSHEKEK